MSLASLRHEINQAASPQRAKASAWFFKSGVGEYGEGDVFVGLTVPQQRIIAKGYTALSLNDLDGLLQSRIHEERLIALIILVSQYKKAGELEKKKIIDFYLSHTDRINNWDLVDTSAEIVGSFLLDKNIEVLKKRAKSKLLWDRRIAIIATFAFIKKGNPRPTFEIAEILLKDTHDLIHKAVGWMLREVGKRCGQEIEEEFLKQHYREMQRTMLRYAIEKFPEPLRKQYLLGLVK